MRNILGYFNSFLPQLRSPVLERAVLGFLMSTLVIVLSAEAVNAQVTCFGQVATIIGTEGDDILQGTAGADVIAGLGGNDTINGKRGDDLLCGDDGNDVINGGRGDDQIDGGKGDDYVRGKIGSDLLLGGLGNDILEGGKGDDTLQDFNGDNTLKGNIGADTITAGDGNDIIEGGYGNDTIDAGDGDNTVKGNPGADEIFAGSGTDYIKGGYGNDFIDAGPGNDIILGNVGADTLNGGSGNDELAGGYGNDTLDGGNGVDSLDGGFGSDTCLNGENNSNCEKEGSSQPAIAITSPAPGSVIDGFTVLVTGVVNVPLGTEVGVTVNGSVALVDTGEFAAQVPVGSEVTSLTATMTDMAGTTLGSDTIPVTVQPAAPGPTFLLRPSPTGGLAPLVVNFNLVSGVPITQIALDLEGDGSIDFQGTSLEEQSFTYAAPGLYLPTVTLTDDVGGTHTAMALIQVDDAAVFDALVQNKWQGMKDALRQGDIEGALSFITVSKRESYRRMFEALGVQTANIDQILTDLSFVEHQGLRAEYQMIRLDNGVRISHFVLFALDDDGIWRVKFF